MVCVRCGEEAYEFFDFDGDWICEDCLKSQFTCKTDDEIEEDMRAEAEERWADVQRDLCENY